MTDVAERYFRVAADAEAAGLLDEALVFFSRSYSRNTSHRPTLERLSFICFEKGQWDNAWRATEALIDRYRQILGEAEFLLTQEQQVAAGCGAAILRRFGRAGPLVRHG